MARIPSLKRQFETAQSELACQRERITAAANGNTSMTFNQCWLLVPGHVQDTYLRARSAVEDIEAASIAAGKAHRVTFGGFVWGR